MNELAGTTNSDLVDQYRQKNGSLNIAKNADRLETSLPARLEPDDVALSPKTAASTHRSYNDGLGDEEWHSDPERHSAASVTSVEDTRRSFSEPENGTTRYYSGQSVVHKCGKGQAPEWMDRIKQMNQSGRPGKSHVQSMFDPPTIYHQGPSQNGTSGPSQPQDLGQISASQWETSTPTGSVRYMAAASSPSSPPPHGNTTMHSMRSADVTSFSKSPLKLFNQYDTYTDGRLGQFLNMEAVSSPVSTVSTKQSGSNGQKSEPKADRQSSNVSVPNYREDANQFFSKIVKQHQHHQKRFSVSSELSNEDEGKHVSRWNSMVTDNRNSSLDTLEMHLKNHIPESDSDRPHPNHHHGSSHVSEDEDQISASELSQDTYHSQVIDKSTISPPLDPQRDSSFAQKHRNLKLIKPQDAHLYVQSPQAKVVQWKDDVSSGSDFGSSESSIGSTSRIKQHVVSADYNDNPRLVKMQSQLKLAKFSEDPKLREKLMLGDQIDIPIEQQVQELSVLDNDNIESASAYDQIERVSGSVSQLSLASDLSKADSTAVKWQDEAMSSLSSSPLTGPVFRSTRNSPQQSLSQDDLQQSDRFPSIPPSEQVNNGINNGGQHSRQSSLESFSVVDTLPQPSATSSVSQRPKTVPTRKIISKNSAANISTGSNNFSKTVNATKGRHGEFLSSVPEHTPRRTLAPNISANVTIPASVADSKLYSSSKVWFNTPDITSISRINTSYSRDQEVIVRSLTDVCREKHWSQVKTLDLSNALLQSVGVLEKFCPQLENLNLANNNLEFLNGIPSTVSYLSLEHNKVVDVTNFEHLFNLVDLSLRKNLLKSMEGLAAVNGLAHLKILALDDNYIFSLKPLAQMSNLRKLSIQRNKLRGDIQIPGYLPNLNHLDLSGNLHIESITGIELLPNLGQLLLDDTRVKRVNSSRKHSALKLLSMSRTLLEELDVSCFPCLDQLVLDSNAIAQLNMCKDVDSVFLRYQTHSNTLRDWSGFENVRELHLTQNHVTFSKLPFAPNATFRNLQVLEMRNVKLEVLPRMFSNQFPNLRQLDLSFNRLKSIAPLKNSVTLERLWLYNNDIDFSKARETISIVQRLSRLEMVDLRENRFTRGFYEPGDLTNDNYDRVRENDAAYYDAYASTDKKFVSTLDEKINEQRVAYQFALTMYNKNIKWLDGLVISAEDYEIAETVYHQRNQSY